MELVQVLEELSRGQMVLVVHQDPNLVAGELDQLSWQWKIKL